MTFADDMKGPLLAAISDIGATRSKVDEAKGRMPALIAYHHASRTFLEGMRDELLATLDHTQLAVGHIRSVIQGSTDPAVAESLAKLEENTRLLEELLAKVEEEISSAQITETETLPAIERQLDSINNRIISSGTDLREYVVKI